MLDYKKTIMKKIRQGSLYTFNQLFRFLAAKETDGLDSDDIKVEIANTLDTLVQEDKLQIFYDRLNCDVCFGRRERIENKKGVVF